MGMPPGLQEEPTSKQQLNLVAFIKTLPGFVSKAIYVRKMLHFAAFWTFKQSWAARRGS